MAETDEARARELCAALCGSDRRLRGEMEPLLLAAFAAVHSDERQTIPTCHSGHRSLPLALWDCPVCHNETRKQRDDALALAQEMKKKRDTAHAAGVREGMEEVRAALELALTVLPDVCRDEPCWGWCWDELNADAQDEVKRARQAVAAALERLAQEKDDG